MEVLGEHVHTPVGASHEPVDAVQCLLEGLHSLGELLARYPLHRLDCLRQRNEHRVDGRSFDLRQDPLHLRLQHVELRGRRVRNLLIARVGEVLEHHFGLGQHVEQDEPLAGHEALQHELGPEALGNHAVHHRLVAQVDDSAPVPDGVHVHLEHHRDPVVTEPSLLAGDPEHDLLHHADRHAAELDGRPDVEPGHRGVEVDHERHGVAEQLSRAEHHHGEPGQDDCPHHEQAHRARADTLRHLPPPRASGSGAPWGCRSGPAIPSAVPLQSWFASPHPGRCCWCPRRICSAIRA